MTGTVSVPTSAPASHRVDKVLVTRLLIVAVLLSTWEVVADSGLLFRDVVPSLFMIGRALVHLLIDPIFYSNLSITLIEIASALTIGGLTGLTIGVVLGGNRFLRRAYEPFIYYLGPTPKIIFFPLLILWFGVNAGSKIAMGALSCFFPVAIAASAGMRQIDKTLIRVGRTFRLSGWQMLVKIYLPAMRAPIVNGLRLGLGVATIGTLLAETKLSNRGLGYMVIQTYTTFDMPRMYALLILLFILSIGATALIGRLSAHRAPSR